MIRLRQKNSNFVICKIPLISKKASKSFDLEAFCAVRTGLEPVTPCVTGMYSNQLN